MTKGLSLTTTVIGPSELPGPTYTCGEEKGSVQLCCGQSVEKTTRLEEQEFIRVGKEILLKIVVQAIPNYAMNVFLLPQDLCTKIERMMNSYWGAGFQEVA